VKPAELNFQRVPDCFCAFTAIKACIDQSPGFDEKKAGCLATGRSRDGNGDGRRLPGLAVRVEYFDEGSLGKLAVA
jgi:hypothetical protein